MIIKLNKSITRDKINQLITRDINRFFQAQVINGN